MKAWVEHYVRLLNVEFEWPSDSLPEVAPVAGPPPGVSKELIRKALSRMKSNESLSRSILVALFVCFSHIEPVNSEPAHLKRAKVIS